MKKIITISGIPGTGKSTFGKWLEKEKGFIYWDLEHETLEELGERTNLGFEGESNIGSFLIKMNSINNVGVIDWGFDPEIGLEIIQNLKKNGIDIWWFDGDRNAARDSFKNRGDVSEELLDIQMKKIERCWGKIEGLYGDNIIKVIEKGPKYTSPNIIYKKMFK